MAVRKNNIAPGKGGMETRKVVVVLIADASMVPVLFGASKG
jgi:hypothetical protein